MSLPGRGEVEIIEIHPSAARTTTGTVEFPNAFTQPVLGLTVQRNITASSGTSPTVALAIEGSLDGGTNWFNISNILAASGTNGTTAASISVFGANVMVPRMRLKYTIAGTTPSVTFQVIAAVYKGA